MSTLIRWMDEKWYPDLRAHWDDQILREWVLAELTPRSIALDLGAGAGFVKEMNFRGLAARICGVDADSRVLSNPLLDEAKLSDVTALPYADDCFDVVISDNVLEHLEVPLKVFKEVARVLKPGGKFLFKTPNKWHYMPTIARVTPHWFHEYINRLRGRAESDTFPTLYRANTKKTIVKLAAQAGLDVERMQRFEARPEYMRLSWLTYLLGAAYERTVNSSEALSLFRILLVGVLRKPERQD